MAKNLNGRTFGWRVIKSRDMLKIRDQLGSSSKSRVNKPPQNNKTTALPISNKADKSIFIGPIKHLENPDSSEKAEIGVRRSC
jgi:hypothetical protein